MNAQQIYDTALFGLRRQGAASVNESGCLYRGDEGRKCAVGMLIPDADYEFSMEQQCSSLLLSKYPRLAYLREHRALLELLQDAHDDYLTTSVEDWEHEMQVIAAHLGLVYTPPTPAVQRDPLFVPALVGGL